MRVASFPGMSPWFRRSLLTEYTDEQLRAMEPREARLSGVTDKANVFHTARVVLDGVEYSATARKAPDALRAALAKAQPVEIVSLLDAS